LNTPIIRLEELLAPDLDEFDRLDDSVIGNPPEDNNSDEK